ncbi:MAG: metallophosphoesterase [Clostridia bacterium]|nr:metallophosphoesterase [Clostridia bacterium]
MIRTTDYELTGRSAASRSLAKLPGQELTVYVLSDIHYDTIQSTEAVKAYLKEIDEARPDLLLLVGDLTDESTPRDSMFELFSEIGSVRTTYGIFSVDGNHDRQTYAPAGSRSFTSEEYSEAMKANGITLLSDECFESDAFRIIGRKDASTRSRSAGNLILTEEQRADPKYTILLDHQPNSGSPEDWADADLVLCGHTHGGQIFPAGLLLELVGYNAGLYREDGYDVIVSSGVAGWGFHTKTQSRAEGVCIKIRPAPEDNSELNG